MTSENQSADVAGVINLDLALSRLGGMRDLYDNILRSFLVKADQFLPEIDRQLEQKAVEDAARSLHTLKGLAATLGATELATICASNEATLKSGVVPADTGLAMKTLQDCMDKTVAALKRLAAESDAAVGKNSDAGSLDQMALFFALDDIDAALKDGNMRAVGLLDDIEQKFGAALEQKLAPLSEAINQLDFELALDATRKLREQF